MSLPLCMIPRARSPQVRDRAISDRYDRQGVRPVDAVGVTERATRILHPSFGSSVVDQSVRSSQSLSVTVMTWVAASIATWPKNCRPSLGGWFGALGAFT